jgi:hypothetical protein
MTATRAALPAAGLRGMTAVCGRCGAVYWTALGHFCPRRRGRHFRAACGAVAEVA